MVWGGLWKNVGLGKPLGVQSQVNIVRMKKDVLIAMWMTEVWLVEIQWHLRVPCKLCWVAGVLKEEPLA